MNISLREINEDNWRECIRLKVRADQERFVATNENALALAYAHKEMEPKAIYNDNVMVGFLMYACDPDDGVYYINRFMVDEKFQGNGYGRKGLEMAIQIIKERGTGSVDIIHKPDNDKAIKLYRGLGFEPTEMKLDDNEISTLNFN